jgi:arsenite methyltransferase
MRDDLAKKLYDGVKKAYSAAAEQPAARHPFPVGRAFAESVGYPKDLLDSLPAQSVEAFAGVSNVSLFAAIPSGSVVLDLGCGAGLDALIAAQSTGPSGRVVGIDFSTSMLRRAEKAAHEKELAWLDFREGTAESLPLGDKEVDVVLVNGIFNLNPKRDAIFKELFRVVRRGGHVYAAELILTERIVASSPPTEAGWFS